MNGTTAVRPDANASASPPADRYNPTVLIETLQRLIDNRTTTAAEIAELTGVAPSTVYRWLKNQSEPGFNAVRILLRHLPDEIAQEAIVTAFVAGSQWQVSRLMTELDLNRDGKIDHDDALDACIESVHAAGEALARVRGNATESADKRLPNLELVDLLHQVVRHCTTAQQILMHLSERRKKARPVGEDDE